ncbi:hypothetical protein [Pendulispora albinea]|uniref:Uncharacterized protein n=1 Tax=Pendulispora albinea TaxID=2741071 RepID=A0ABZ2LMP7_9BACT
MNRPSSLMLSIRTIAFAASILAWVLAAIPGRAENAIARPSARRAAPKRTPYRQKPPRRKKPAEEPSPKRETAEEDTPAPGGSDDTSDLDPSEIPLVPDPDPSPEKPAASPSAASPSAASPAATKAPGPERKELDKHDEAHETSAEEASDDEDAWTTAFGAELGLDSRLVWRGLSETRGAVVRPEANVGFYGVTLSAWGGFLLNTEGEHHALHMAAGDVAVDYPVHLTKQLRFEPAVTLLYSPERFDSGMTAEIAIDLSYRLGDFRLVNGNGIDIKDRPGAYFGTLGAAFAHDTGKRWTVDAFANVGVANATFNDEYIRRNVTAIDVAQAGVSARYHISSLFYFDLHAQISTLVAPSLRENVREPTLLIGGAAFGLDYTAGRRER